MVNVGKMYVAKLFSPEAKTAIICNPDKANDIASAFAQLVFITNNLHKNLIFTLTKFFLQNGTQFSCRNVLRE